jgi:hypothetical protein
VPAKFEAGYLSTVQNGLIVAQPYGFGKSNKSILSNWFLVPLAGDGLRPLAVSGWPTSEPAHGCGFLPENQEPETRNQKLLITNDQK